MRFQSYMKKKQKISQESKQEPLKKSMSYPTFAIPIPLFLLLYNFYFASILNKPEQTTNGIMI